MKELMKRFIVKNRYRDGVEKKEALIHHKKELLPRLSIAYRDLQNGGFENLNHQSNINNQSNINPQPEVLPEALEGSSEKTDS